MRYNAFWVLAALVLVSFFSPQVQAIPVDLSAFHIDPSVTVSSSSATIAEDPSWAPVGLLNFALDIPADALSSYWEGYIDSDNYWIRFDWELKSVLTISHVEINPVPEPVTLLLLGSGLL